MRSTQVLALAGLMLAGKFAMAAKLEHDDVPNMCWDACGPVVGQASECDRYDKDRAELDCICKWEAAKAQIPLCAACISKYDRDHDHDHDHDHDDDHDDDDDDNDALDIVHSCSFTTTSYNSAAATTLSGSATGTAAASSTASTTGGASSGSGSGGGGSSGSEAAASTPTTDAAAGLSAPGTISMAAFVGLLPLAWL